MTIDNHQDIIDSRDVIGEIDALVGLEEDENIGLDEGEAEYLFLLRELNTEGEEASADWQYGATLIRDSYFETYAQQFAEDIGAIGSDMQWPVYCIDWEQAAKELQMDYTTVEFDGVTYWVR